MGKPGPKRPGDRCRQPAPLAAPGGQRHRHGRAGVGDRLGTLPDFYRPLGENCNNWHIVEEALAQNKGIIFITPHLGNYDIAGRYLSQRLIKRPQNTNSADGDVSPAENGLAGTLDERRPRA